MRITIASILSVTLLLATGQDQTAQSGQGGYEKRSPPSVSAEAQAEMEAQLKEAQAQYAANPKSADALIWVGRRLAYLGRFTEAIETYTNGIALFPSDARFFRHRGHRWITLRRFDRAISDFEKAARLIKGEPDEIEPDGQPNARNIPTSTLQFNIWYHLGLAYYLNRQKQQALRAYRECLKVSDSPDRLVSTTHWLYMTLRRLNREREAAKVLEPIHEGMDIIENDSYYRLCLMYKGLVSADQLLQETTKQPHSPATLSILYGIANWHSYNGRQAQAFEIFRGILGSKHWTSFGYIAAEVDTPFKLKRT